MTTNNQPIPFPFQEALTGDSALERLQADIQALIAHFAESSNGRGYRRLVNMERTAFRAETIAGNLLTQFDAYLINDWQQNVFSTTEMPECAWACVIRVAAAGTVVQVHLAVNPHDDDPAVQVIVRDLISEDTVTEGELTIERFVEAANRHASAKLSEMTLSA